MSWRWINCDPRFGCYRDVALVLVKVRPALETDYDVVARIWWESWRTVGVTVAQDSTIQELRALIPENIEQGWDLYVAEEAGRVCAMMAIELDDNHLDQLFVDPDYKGQGIGTLLLNHAKSKMPGGMWLRTARSNTPAIEFYRRHGFAHERDDLHPRLRYPVVYYRWAPVDRISCNIE